MWRSAGWLSLLAAFLCFCPHAAFAETLQAAIDSKAFTLSDDRVACAPPGGGWLIEPSSAGHALRPPRVGEAVGSVVELKVAASLSACATAATTVELVATSHPPNIDPTSVVLQPDLGKLDVRGHRLAGIAVAWRSNTASGVDVCAAPKLESGIEHCTFDVGRGLPADPASDSLSLISAGGRAGSDGATFDADGKLISVESLLLRPARGVVSNVVPADASIDLSTGRGEVELTHPDAVASVDCGAEQCELTRNGLLVRSLSSNVGSVDVKFHLVSGVFVSKGAGFDAAPTAHLAVVHCPMSVPSGPVLKNTDDAAVVVRIEGRCASEVPSLRFVIGSEPAEIISNSGRKRSRAGRDHQHARRPHGYGHLAARGQQLGVGAHGDCRSRGRPRARHCRRTHRDDGRAAQHGISRNSRA